MSKKAPINYKKRMRDIRRYVDFDYDLRKPLTRSQKAKVNRYWKEIDALTARPYTVFKPRRKDHLKTAQEFAAHEHYLPGLKVAFIQVADPSEKPRIKFDKKNNLVMRTRHVTTVFLALNKRELIKDAADHVNRVIQRDGSANWFTIAAGRYEVPGAVSRGLIAKEFAKFVTKYSNNADNKEFDNDSNHYFGNWLHGLKAHHFKEQADLNDYLNVKAAASEAKRKERARKARVARRENYDLRKEVKDLKSLLKATNKLNKSYNKK